MRTIVVVACVLVSTFAVFALANSLKAPVASLEALPPHGGAERPREVSDAYERWRAAHEENGGDRNVDVVLRWHKALSSEATAARGMAHLDLVEGSVSVELEGLKQLGAVDIWFVDNVEGPGRSLRPEPGDRFLYAGALESDAAGKGTLSKFVGAELRTFEVDLVVVTRKDSPPSEAGILFGSLPLFQRLYSLDRIRRTRS